MYVYIRQRGNGGEQQLLPVVSLVDGCIPQFLTSKSGHIHQLNVNGLEPALWFKVIVLDAILIDCECNLIQWTTCEGKCQIGRRVKNMFVRCSHSQEINVDEEYYTPDVDLQQGMQLAQQIAAANKDDIKEEFLQLLHLFILPIIRLHSADVERVQDALKRQVTILDKIGKNMDNLSQHRNEVKKTLLSWRQDLCNKHLNTEEAIHSSNVDFLQQIYDDLTSDIQNAYVELELCQKKVDEAKKKVRDGPSSISNLARNRKTRDNVVSHITNALYVIEEIKMLFRQRQCHPNHTLTPTEEAYLKTQHDWKRLRKQLEELQRVKVCATSIREALVSTLKELKEGKDSVGFEHSVGGVGRSTDILSPGSYPKEWETLQTQVTTLFEDESFDLSHVHMLFCNSVIEECRVACSGGDQWIRQSINLSRPIPVQKVNSDKGGDTTSPMSHSPPAVQRMLNEIHDRMPEEHLKGITKKIKKDVRQHFEKMCGSLLHDHFATLNDSMRKFYDKVVGSLMEDTDIQSRNRSRLWTSYERCFFHLTSRSILQLYEKAYSSKTNLLQIILSQASLEALQINDAWILNIMGLYRSNKEQKPPTNSAPSVARSRLNERCESGISMTDDPPSVKSNLCREDSQASTSTIGRLSSLSPNDNLCPGSSKAEKCKSRSNRGSAIIDGMYVPTSSATLPVGVGLQMSPTDKDRRVSPERSYPSLSQKDKMNGGASLLSRIVITPVTKDDGITDDSGVFCERLNGELCNQNSHKPLKLKNSIFYDEQQTNGPISLSGILLQEIPANSIPKHRGGIDLQEFLESYGTAFQYLNLAVEDRVPVSKLQWLYRCIKEVNTVAEQKSKQISLGAKTHMLSGEDLLTALILFLLHGDPHLVAKLYYHLAFLQDYMPPFLEINQHGFTVTQFWSALSYMQCQVKVSLAQT